MNSFILVVHILLAVGIIFGRRFLMRNKVAAMVESQTLTTSVEVMGLQSSVSVTGTLAAGQTQSVTSTVATGTEVAAVYYEVGDYVEEGTPLPPLDYHRHGTLGVLGLGCTFCCCDTDGALPKRLGIQLNSHGMYPDEQSAMKAAEIVNKERLGEPCHYLPFALFLCK